MHKIPINDSEAQYLQLFRVALSEPKLRHRLEAIRTVKLEVQSDRISMHVNSIGADRPSEHDDLRVLTIITETEPARLEAARDYMQLYQRYEGKNRLGNERKLNIAEQIGKMVLLTIREEKFEGLHTPGGILEQVREQAVKSKVRGGVDRDTLRKIWSKYRGVVPLGMALDHCEDFPDDRSKVFRLAENTRRELAGHCPRSTSKPYVDPAVQISFVAVTAP